MGPDRGLAKRIAQMLAADSLIKDALDFGAALCILLTDGLTEEGPTP